MTRQIKPRRKNQHRENRNKNTIYHQLGLLRGATENDFLCCGEHVETQSDFILVADAGEEVVFFFGLGHCVVGVDGVVMVVV